MVKGVKGGIRIKKPTKQFKQAITIKQVGAEGIRTPKGVVFRLGGGIFTKKQILASRQRFGRVKYGLKVSKKAVGL